MVAQRKSERHGTVRDDKRADYVDPRTQQTCYGQLRWLDGENGPGRTKKGMMS